jgi:hypothetical protein
MAPDSAPAISAKGEMVHDRRLEHNTGYATFTVYIED